jgi:hypothetical protein
MPPDAVSRIARTHIELTGGYKAPLKLNVCFDIGALGCNNYKRELRALPKWTFRFAFAKLRAG